MSGCAGAPRATRGCSTASPGAEGIDGSALGVGGDRTAYDRVQDPALIGVF